MSRTSWVALLCATPVVSIGWLSSAAPVVTVRMAAARAEMPAHADLRVATADIGPLGRATPRPALSDRDPFTFGARAAPASRAPADRRAALHADVALASPAAASDPPPPTLAGIAEQDAPEGLIRTAVLMNGDAVQFAREGQVIDGVHRVTRITADRVVLVNLHTGASSQLVLQ